MAPIRNISFKYHGVPLNWTNAVEICEEEGGRLFMTDSQEKNDFIYRLWGSSENGAVPDSGDHMN